MVSLAVIILFGCAQDDEAKALGFSDLDEMKDIHSKGWHTKSQYNEDRAKAEGFASWADMVKAEAARAKEQALIAQAQRDKAAAAAQAKKAQADQELGAKQQAELERKRVAEEREASDKAEATARLARQNFPNEFPYYAVVSCGFSGQHINVIACFVGRVGTEFELRNGDDYGLYKAHEISQLGEETQDGLRIKLRRNFQIRAQNSDERLVLGIVVYDVDNDKKVFQKQVAQFGMISVKN